MRCIELTLDSEPGVGGGVSRLVGGGALEHAGVLPPHVVDHQAPVLGDVVPYGLDAVQGLGVTIPRDLWLWSALHVAGNLQLLPDLAERFESQFLLQPRFLCKEKI